MEFLTSIVGSIGGEIAKYTLAPLGRQIGYLIFYNGNIKNLEKEMNKLKERKTAVDLQVDDAERNLHIPAPEMKKWQQNVDDINGRANKFLEEEIKRNRKCLNDLCPNPKSRYSLSRNATKMTQEILLLLNEAEKYMKINLPAPPPPLAPIFNTEDVEEFESRNLIMNDILEALRNDSVSMMSICGPGGVGKTTMVGKLVEFIERETLFEVAMAAVSQNPDVKKIQGDIASRLGLEFHDENEQQRALKLHERIVVKSEKKILLILDDVWTEMDFLRLQFPSAGKRAGYKILLTSRREDECRKMGCLNFRVDALSKEEGWNLFNGIAFAGHSIDNQDNLHQLAKQIADECDGLPLVIVAIAKALKGRDVRTWANALTKLQSNNLKGISGVDEKVYLRLELSYNLIQSEEAKACFLLCCLFPEDYNIPIEDLVRYAVGLRLLDSFETISEARNSVHALVGELQESSLLLHGNDDEDKYVTMHDVFRDVAISIAKTYLVSCDNMMNCWPNRWIGRYDDCTAISLFSEKIEEYPSDLKCPKLQILQLRSRSLPITFFEGMEDLKVVDLEGCFPPVSLNAAKEVRTLLLSDVESTSNIEKLMNVEILEIWRCGELPNGVGLMRNLRLLDLSDAVTLKYIPAGRLSGLSKLEELYVSLEFAEWESRLDGERMNASLKELDSRHMTTLEIGVSNISHLPKSSILDKIIKFKIRVGLCEPIRQKPGNKLILTGDATEIARSGICVLLKRTEHLRLENVHNLKNDMHVLGDEGFPELKTLQMSKCDDIERLVDENKIKDGCFRMLRELNINNCKKLEYMFPTTMTTRLSQSLQSIDIYRCPNMKAIFNGKEEGNDVEFPHLKEIRLSDLPNLKALWMHKSNDQQLVKSNSMEQPNSLLFPSSWIVTANLKKLRLYHCHSLEVVFSTSAAKQLQHLQILYIINCSKVEYIVGGEEGNTNNTFIFPMLTEVSFWDLPELVSFCVHNHIFMDWSSLEDVSVKYCSKIQTIIGSVQSSSALDKKQILFKIPAELKQPLKVKIVYVSKCHSLMHVFTSLVAKLLVKLEDLQIWESRNMEQVIAKEEGEEEAIGITEIIEFSHLKSITLYDLVNMRCFYGGSHAMEFPLLESLIFYKCFSMKTFSSGSSLSTPKLKTVKVDHIDIDPKSDLNTMVRQEILTKLRLHVVEHLQMISLHHLSNEEMGEIRQIRIDCCRNLSNVIPCDLIERLQKVEILDVEWCDAVEQIFEYDGVNNDNGTVAISSHLQQLNLGNLGNLKHVFNKIPTTVVVFPKLKLLNIYSCRSLKNIFSVSMVRCLLQLKELRISRCDGLEEIVAKEDEEEKAVTDNIVLPLLRSVDIFYASKLKCFYSGTCALELPSLTSLKLNGKDYPHSGDINEDIKNELFGKVDIGCTEDFMKICQSTEDLRNIKYLSISNCRWSLYAIFSISMVKDLVKLEELEISCCDGVEQIVANDEDEEEEITHKIVFPKLRRIDISSSIEGSFGIKCFYSGMYALDFPLLESLNLDKCYGMTTFSTGSLTTPALQKLWINEKDYPCTGDLNKDLKDKMLERVVVSGYENFMRICQTAEEGSTRIRYLSIQFSDKLFNEIPCSVIRNLEELHVRWCDSVEGIFELDKQTTFSSLAIIKLEYLDDLKHIFYNIPKGFAGFQQLTRLEVTLSDRLEYVFPFSIVRGLPQLQHVHISLCDGMEQIIGEKDQLGEEESITQKISLPELKSIHVRYLVNLKCFYNGSCDIEFPLLETLIIDECDNMKTFSNGSVSTPKLQTVELGDKDHYPYSGNLNAFFQKKWLESR